MTAILRTGLMGTYLSVMSLLALYGCHRLYLLVLLHRHSRTRAGVPPWSGPLPLVTVQIPIFNEYNVAQRVIEAVCALDYPVDRLEIQVLDDSTDDTSERIDPIVARLRGLGHDVRVLRRSSRSGFKAGALAEGLAACRGEFVAVFDADFLPRPGFLRTTIPHFHDPAVGMVQARWGHLNRETSALTRVQALLLDGHFLIEHAARHLSGRFFNFNGTAGIWRRTCIEDAGGWQHDTLTEDLDLSYRAQLAGWKFVFVADTVAPAELPVEMSAFRSQQHRWAKGSIQTARKLLPALLGSSFSLPVRTEAAVHLTANFGYVLMLAFSVLLVPAMLVRARIPLGLSIAFDLPILLFSTFSYWLFYAAAEIEGGRGAARALRTLPMLMAVGVGLSVNNARAVLEGLLCERGSFERTPKHGIQDGRGGAPARAYRTARIHLPWIETLLALYFSAGIVLAVRLSLWSFLPFLLLFWIGFAHCALAIFMEALRGARCALDPGEIGATR